MQVLPSRDSLDEPDFNTIDYINTLFPTEQSLSNIDEVVIKMENQMHTIDNEISTVIHSQIEASKEGRLVCFCRKYACNLEFLNCL